MWNEPGCWKRSCSYSELAVPEADIYIEMFRLLKSDFVVQNGLAKKLMNEAGAMTSEFIELMAELESVVKIVNAESSKQSPQSSLSNQFKPFG